MVYASGLLLVGQVWRARRVGQVERPEVIHVRLNPITLTHTLLITRDPTCPTGPTCPTRPTCPAYPAYVNSRTSRIVYHPRLPWIHFAAASAPRANADRSRAACVSVIVSAGPSKPMVCVPGMKPARVDDTSIGRANPACCIDRCSSSAVPDGASFFAAWCAS